MTPLFCSACRHANSVGDRFCIACGSALPPATQPQNNANAGRRTRRKWLKWTGIGCGGFIALFVVVIVLAAIFGGDMEEREEPEPARVASSKPSPTLENSVLDQTAVVSPTPRAPSNSPAKRPILTPMPSPEPTATHTPTLVPTATPTPVPIQMKLSELLNEYDQNKVRADTQLRYQKNGKIPVSTSGYVSHVEELYIILFPTQERYSNQKLYCYYSDVRAALDVTKRQHISVTGRVIGKDGYSSAVHMFACEFEGMDYEKNPTLSAEELSKNVVQVFCIQKSGLFSSSGFRGTGVIIDSEEGIILTVHHVIADENECERIEVEIPGIESRIPATTVRHCASIDRARLRISPEVLANLSLQPIYRAAAPAQEDQEIYFWGYGPGELRMESGIVMDVWGFGDDRTITDAYAVPGDSGSPVFDEYGHLLGTMSTSNRSDRATFIGHNC